MTKILQKLRPESCSASRKRLLRSFTLMETLVVVSIVAVLAALLLPAVQSVADKGKAAVCAGKLRQIGVANNAYASENNGLLVPCRIQPGSAGYYWVGQLAPYLGAASTTSGFTSDPNRTPYMCPVSKTNSTGSTYYQLPISTTLSYRTRYDINPHITSYYSSDLAAAQTYRSGRLAQMNAARTYLVMDCFGSGGAAYWVVTSGRLTYPHGGMINVLYVDGHIEAKSPEQMKYYANNPYHVFWRGYDWGYGNYKED